MNPRVGAAIAGLGVILVAVGLIGGLVAGGGDSDPSDAGAQAAEPSGESESTSPQASTSTSTPETPDEFYAFLQTAFQEGDVDGMIARLHPEVVALYGEEQCRAFLSGQPTRTIEVVEVGSTEDFDFGARDDVDLVIRDTLVVTVRQVIEGNEVETDSHIVLADDGTFRWFSDCGDPAVASGG